MPDPGQLSVNDRVLLHLSRFASDVPPEDYPPETTQAGIAVAVGISRTHVPRAVRGLIGEGLVGEITARVKGHERRMNVYVVTSEGLATSERLWKALQEQPFEVLTSGKTVSMSGKDLESMVGRKRAQAAVSQMREGTVQIDERRRTPVRDLKDAPALGPFHGRETELRAMDEFMDSASKTLVVLGNKGFGGTALTRKFVEGLDEEDVLWIQLSQGMSAERIESMMIDFGKRIEPKVASIDDVLALDNEVIVLDDYFSAEEGVVELFASIVESAKNAKTIVTARQETPAYNWFYRKEHVDSGIVREIRLKGLDEQSAKKLLGNSSIEADALKRIMMMTRGQPMVLKMLKEGDVKGLKENTVFTAEEIRYLLFLKDKNQ
jgi:hypothetical protein